MRSGAMREATRRRGRRMHPLMVAAIVIAATAAITYYAFNQGLPFVHRFTLYALVNNSVNVHDGSPVRIAGIDVGSVDGVSAVGDASKVEFTVNRDALPIHRDATIRVRDRLFLEGSYYLELDPGTPNAPAMRDGEEIPLSQTSSPVQFYSVLSTFDVAARTSLANLLNSLSQGLGAPAGRSLASSGAAGWKSSVPQMAPLFRDTALFTRGFRGTQPNDVHTVLSSFASVMNTLAGSSAQLADLFSGLNATSAALSSSDGALAQSFSELDQTVQDAPRALTSIDRSLPSVVDLATALDPSLKVSPPILDGLIATVNQLITVLAPVQRAQLLTSLKATFAELPAIETQLASTFPIGKQITDCLQSNILPALRRTVPDGSLSTGRPAWQDFVHFLPGVGGATGSFDANGPYTRIVGGAGTNTLAGGPVSGEQLIGTAPPGGSSLIGSRPSWIGDLTSEDFRPDVPCRTQKVPSLASSTAPPDLHPAKSPPAPLLSRDQVAKLMAGRSTEKKGRGR
jgi:virulence factor Mce-like protein